VKKKGKQARKVRIRHKGHTSRGCNSAQEKKVHELISIYGIQSKDISRIHCFKEYYHIRLNNGHILEVPIRRDIKVRDGVELKEVIRSKVSIRKSKLLQGLLENYRIKIDSVLEYQRNNHGVTIVLLSGDRFIFRMLVDVRPYTVKGVLRRGLHAYLANPKEMRKLPSLVGRKIDRETEGFGSTGPVGPFHKKVGPWPPGDGGRGEGDR